MKNIIKAQTLKGFRDFLPQEARKRQYVIDVLKSVFELYGFEPLETPALEYEEILLGKYGEEGDKLMYRFTDNGGRKVALRYDQTVPLARVVSQYAPRGDAGGSNLPTPFKRYQIQPVWRAENPQKGRFREFLQCDVDTIGVENLWADTEIVACAIAAMKKLGFSNDKLYTRMRINDRAIFDVILDELKIDTNIRNNVIILLDKKDKIGLIETRVQLGRLGLELSKVNELIDRLNGAKENENLKSLFSQLKEFGLKQDFDFIFDQYLARGLDYYTSTIFELELMTKIKTEDIGLSAPATVFSPKLSLGGGGRYDNLIGIFANKTIPAVGFSFGFDRLIEAIEDMKLFPEDLLKTKVLVTVFSKELMEESVKISSRLRDVPDGTSLRSNNINVEMWLDPDSKLDKQIKYADKKGIPFVIIVGPDEVKNNTVTVKNLKTREQKTIEKEKLYDYFQPL